MMCILLRRYAAANNVALMTFDNEAELYKVKDLYPDAKMVIRICVDDSKSLCQVIRILFTLHEVNLKYLRHFYITGLCHLYI